MAHCRQPGRQSSERDLGVPLDPGQPAQSVMPQRAVEPSQAHEVARGRETGVCARACVCGGGVRACACVRVWWSVTTNLARLD